MSRRHHAVRSRVCITVALSAVVSVLLVVAGVAVPGPALARTSSSIRDRARAATRHSPRRAKESAVERSYEQKLTGPVIRATAGYRPAPCNKPVPAGDARCWALMATPSGSVRRAAAADGGPLSTALGPAQIQAAYHLPANGRGQTVAIVDAFGYSKAESDLATFRSQYGLPACTTANGCFIKVNQRGDEGKYPADNDGWALESALDMDAVSSACPSCHILLVEGDSTSSGDLGAAVDTAVRLGAKVVSNSYGVPGEFPDEQQADRDYDHPGVAITVSTGDVGNVQEWPATSPDVTAVGGTTLTTDSSSARGWQEAAWSSGGSGCSHYEPTPHFQHNVDTGCTTRAVADVSADANPDTGLSIYDSLGENGWGQYGGTSLSAPLVAAMYALAGPQPVKSHPVESLYDNQGVGLNDVTSGSDGTCATVACNAAKGWDGPTGWGTPNGVAGLTLLRHGVLSGTVVSSGTAVKSATISFTDDGHTYNAISNSAGKYSLDLVPGTYSYSASAYGYLSARGSGVTITAGTSSTADITMAKAPTVTLSGKVRDGSGHGWPLYARVTVNGYPGGPIYTNPDTGRYRVTLPGRHAYVVRVAPVAGGYRSVTARVTLGRTPAHLNAAPRTVTTSAVCDDAPGYGFPACADFDGWSGTSALDGWSTSHVAADPTQWTFENPGGLRVYTGGEGNEAVVAPGLNHDAPADATLTSPVFDLAHVKAARLAFDYALINGAASASLSLDGGSTWHPVWSERTSGGLKSADIALPHASGTKTVRIRLHYAATGSAFFGVDNVTVGVFREIPGGLVTGHTLDANTGRPVSGATVTDAADPSVTTVSTATPHDTGIADGYFSIFDPNAGRRHFAVVAARYATAIAVTKVVADRLSILDPKLPAGQLLVRGTSLTAKQSLGASSVRSFTVTNTGSVTAHFSLAQQDDGFEALQHPGVVPAHTVSRSDSTWQSLPDLPQPVLDNAVGTYQGDVYTFGGDEGIVGTPVYAHSYVYRPGAGSWKRVAAPPTNVLGARGAFVDGSFYLVGGYTYGHGTVTAQRAVYAYRPRSDSWRSVAPLPKASADGAVAELGGMLYLVGGCRDHCDSSDNSVYRYDPRTNRWTTLAGYPLSAKYESCEGLVSVRPEIVCAGGITQSTTATTYLSATYAYNPNTNRWSSAAAMPDPGWGMSSAGADGRMQVANSSNQSETNGVPDDPNTVFEYDPVANAWTRLADTISPHLRGSGGCGFVDIGGDNSTTDFFATGGTAAEILPGYDQCGNDDVSWLSENRTRETLRPGQSVRIDVTADSRSLAQPGTYRSSIELVTDTPNTPKPVSVTLEATPPAHWGLVSGVVTDTRSGTPIAGATVQICTMFDGRTGRCGARSYTLSTGRHGVYRFWLDARYDPLHVTASSDGYLPSFRVIRIRPDHETLARFALAPRPAQRASSTTARRDLTGVRLASSQDRAAQSPETG